MFQKRTKNISGILFLFILFSFIIGYQIIKGQEITKNEVGADEMISLQQATSIAITDFQKTLGKLPNKFELIIEDQINIVKISLVTDPSLEGGSLEIKIDKKSGDIIERIAGQ